ncbi:MAG: DUF541 domain-containing protein [Alphaproteobacteria bacterium]|nr:DUF541 domain-containing protein [Alphaproteobacteria bacterium]
MMAIPMQSSRRLKGRFLGGAFLLLAGSLASACAQETSRPADGVLGEATIATLSVTGNGEVSAAPDQATLRFAVETQAATAAAAMNAASSAARQIIAALEKAGVEKKDLATSGISLAPDYDYGENGRNRELKGYVASNAMTVRVSDLDDVGAIVDGAINAGANRLDGIELGFADPGKLLDEARERAVKDARRKAELYAKAANVSVGRILSISEPGAAAPLYAKSIARSMQADSFAAQGAPIEPGEATLSASINLILEIE